MVQEKLKINELEAPTMFIGVGGTGCKIIKKVYEKCAEGEREQISFVCLDTNVNDLKNITRDCKGIKAVQTSNTQTVGSYLDIDQDASKHWFPKNAVIYDKTVSEGAGQLRAISRLAFNSTIKTGKIAPLFDAIDDLFKKNGQEMKQALRICIVSTASGGTGSGMLLPFSMFVRDYVNNKYPNASVILRMMILLPETLDKVIKSNIEKDSQRRNAYATIKELNAFMMKGSGFCEIEEPLKRYKDIHIDVTDPGRDELKRLSLLPCDFCFLLDGQDAEDATSNSFEQYQNQAALALYEQMVGPMQKKAFSVEDNIIKELSNPGNYGRNRFGGIGAGRIIYPYEEIINYIAYEWAKDSIGSTSDAAKWLKFDKEVEKRLLKDKENEVSEADMTKWEEAYPEILDTKADASDKFAKDLRSTYGLGDTDSRIEMFLDALKGKITEAVENKSEVKTVIAATGKLKNATIYENPANWKSAPEDYRALIRYFNVVKKHAERAARNAAGVILFSEGTTQKLSESPENLESLMRANNHYLHPNAARFVLYKLHAETQKTVKNCDSDISDANKKVSGKLESREGKYELKGRKADKNIASLEELCSRYSSLAADNNKKSEKIGQSNVERLGGDMRGLYLAINQLKEAYINKAMYEVLDDYVNRLLKQYKAFYDSFDKKFVNIQIKQNKLTDGLKYKKGDSVLYICSDKEVLDELSRETNKKKDAGQMLDDELNAQIFDKVKRNVEITKDAELNPEAISEKKSDIFDDVLIGFFRESVYKNCKEIDLDIIHAIEKEKMLKETIKARNEKKESDDETDLITVSVSDKEIDSYILSVIEKGEKLSAPGVQKMVGEEAREVNVCAYNSSLKDMRDHDVNALMSNGEAVDTVSKYELHYFNALYNLTPDKLKKFAAPRISETGERAAGLYHNAYTTYTSDIGPDCLKSSKMTTHIDRRWDSIAAMPELDLEYQQTQFLRTHKALVYGLVFQRIKKQLYLDDNAQLENAARAYRYMNTKNHIEDMVVTNGTLCDEFYEVLDSLYIDRALVEDIYRFESRETRKDIMKRSKYEETVFFKKVDEFKLEDHGDEIASLFEIPLNYYNSIPSYMMDEFEINSLVDAVIDVFRRQISKYESEKNAKFVLCKILQDQYDLLMKNYENNSKVNKGVKAVENKVLRVILRKIDDVLESSPQPENYKDVMDDMMGKLSKE